MQPARARDQCRCASRLVILIGYIELRRLISDFLGQQLRACWLRLSIVSTGARASLRGFRARVLSRISAFDRHLVTQTLDGSEGQGQGEVQVEGETRSEEVTASKEA